jgi:uncharacterized repeat protein (TIGR03803 family)
MAGTYEPGDYVKVEFPDETTGIGEWMWVRIRSHAGCELSGLREPGLDDDAARLLAQKTVTVTAPALGCGTLFKIESTGLMTVEHVFRQTDGEFPLFLAIDPSDNLYGATLKGGDAGLGEVFKFDSQGNFSIIHGFSGADGEFPGGLAVSNGKILGTVGAGGDLSACVANTKGCGVVFEMNPDGSNFRLLHTFEDSPDGAFPYIFLATDRSGRVYGTTTEGGQIGISDICQSLGCGTLYALTP